MNAMSDTELRILASRQTWARRYIAAAWRRVSVAEATPEVPDDLLDRLNASLRDAIAVGQEWGLDVAKIIDALAEDDRTRQGTG